MKEGRKEGKLKDIVESAQASLFLVLINSTSRDVFKEFFGDHLVKMETGEPLKFAWSFWVR